VTHSGEIGGTSTTLDLHTLLQSAGFQKAGTIAGGVDRLSKESISRTERRVSTLT